MLVTDAAGQPLAGAVVMLEPAGAKLPVKPMQGVNLEQSKRQFNPQVTVVTVGTAVNFPNFDTVRHHVYSFSPIKSFELKLYAGMPAAPVVFDKPGIAVVGCNIHDQMAAWIVVVDTPHHARTDAGGRVRLANIAPGAYKLRGWHSGMAANVEPATESVAVSSSETNLRMKLPVGTP